MIFDFDWDAKIKSKLLLPKNPFILCKEERIMPVEFVTTETWEMKIERADTIVLVEFMTHTCPNCTEMVPVLEELSQKYAGKAAVYMVDAAKEQPLAMNYGIMGVPTFKILCKGRPVSEQVGAVYPAKLAAFVEEGMTMADECVARSSRISYGMDGYA